MTVLAVGVMATLTTAALVGAVLAGLVATQHRAAAAADLAALAAAAAPGQACDTAREVAADNSAELRSCTRAGPVVTVEVVIEARVPLGLHPTVRSRARAGPADIAHHDQAG